MQLQLFVRRFRSRLRLVAGGQAVVMVATLAVTAVSVAITSVASAKTPSEGWLIAPQAIDQLRSAGASDAYIAKVLDRRGSFVIHGAKNRSTFTRAVKTESFRSYQDLEAAIVGGKLLPGTKAVLYDNEGWSFTPLQEQRDPVGYAKKAYTLAHAHGLLLINTPATDLAKILDPKTTAPYDTMLAKNIYGGMARYSDVLEIQAQGSQGTAKYASFVKRAVAQARAVRPNVTIFAGMSTNPQGRTITSAQLIADYKATYRYVDGYWMNIPQASGSSADPCPGCGPANPAAALGLFHHLYGT